MKKNLVITIIFIAVYLTSTGASAQNNIYRCGNSYSQKPCADAQLVDVQDPRTAEQKLQADATTKRDTATGNAVEKARLKDEAHQRAAQAKLAASQNKGKGQQSIDPTTPSDVTYLKPSKRKSRNGASKHPKYPPGTFVAIEPGSGTKPPKRRGKGQ